MNKLNKKLIVFGLGTLAILAFVIIAPKDTKAQSQYGGYISSIKPEIVKADNPKPVINSIDPNYSNIGAGNKTITITGENFVPDSIGRVNGSNRPTTFIDSYHLLMTITGNDTYTYFSNGGFFITVFNPAPAGGYSNTIFFTISNDTSGTGSNFSNTTTNHTPGASGNNANNNGNNGSNLTSNAIFGADGIFHSGLIQWIFAAILVLVAVILVRRIYGADKRYHATPMKHD